MPSNIQTLDLHIEKEFVHIITFTKIKDGSLQIK